MDLMELDWMLSAVKCFHYCVLGRLCAPHAEYDLLEFKGGILKSKSAKETPLALVVPTSGLPQEHSFVNVMAGGFNSFEHRRYRTGSHQPTTPIPNFVNIDIGMGRNRIRS